MTTWVTASNCVGSRDPAGPGGHAVLGRGSSLRLPGGSARSLVNCLSWREGTSSRKGHRCHSPFGELDSFLKKTLWRHDSPTPRGQSRKCPSSPPPPQRPALSFSPTPSKPQKVNSLGYRPRSFRPSRPVQPCPSRGSRMLSENTTHKVRSAAPVYWPPAPADGELSGPPDGRNRE